MSRMLIGMPRFRRSSFGLPFCPTQQSPEQSKYGQRDTAGGEEADGIHLVPSHPLPRGPWPKLQVIESMREPPRFLDCRSLSLGRDANRSFHFAKKLIHATTRWRPADQAHSQDEQ